MKNKKLWFIFGLILTLFASLAPGPSGDVFRFMEDHEVLSGEKVAGSVLVLGGDLSIGKDASISGDAISIFGNLKVEGQVNGSIASVFGNTTVTNTALVIGEGATFYGKMDVASGTVLGDTAVVEPPASYANGNLLPVLTTTVIVLAVFVYLISCLVYLLFPKRVAIISGAVPKSLGRRFLIGFLINIAIIPLLIVLVITVVGILLIPFIGIVYVALNLLAGVALALAVGKRITGESKECNEAGECKASSPYIFLLTGVLVVFVISIIPVLGWLIYAGGSCIALGAAIDTRLGEVVDGQI